MLLVTSEQMKKIEYESDKNGVSFSALMENAGKSLAEFINSVKTDLKSILFLCGKGNNAGDCFVASRFLIQKGWNVTLAMLCGKPETDISIKAFEKSNASLILWDKNDIIEFAEDSTKYSIAADGVFGTGFHGDLPETIKKVFNAVKGYKIAVDIPSGGNGSTGAASENTFKADATVTFGYRKFGMTQYPLLNFCGKIFIKDIGLNCDPEKILNKKIRLITDQLTNNIIPAKKPDSHKGNFGRLVTVCGSRKMPGACIMSAVSAARCGVGLLTTATVSENIPIMSMKIPEVMFEPLLPDDNGFMVKDNLDKIITLTKKASAVLIGCGIGITPETKILVKELIRNINCPIILDADGINCISDSINIIRETRSGIILTPHPAEMSRLTGKSIADIQSDRLNTAVNFSAEYGAVTVLKGAGTIITDGNNSYVNLTGNPGMGKGGSGDILSGMIASFAAQGISLTEACMISVYLHGKAGDKAAKKMSMQSMLPTDIIGELPGLLKEMEK